MLPHPQHPHNNNPTPSTVDIALRNEMVAVEVDGSAHWTQNEPYVPLGRTIWHWRILASRGWRLVSVPYFRWARLESLAAKKQYLWQLLQASGVRVWGVWGGERRMWGDDGSGRVCAIHSPPTRHARLPAHPPRAPHPEVLERVGLPGSGPRQPRCALHPARQPLTPRP